MGKTLTILTVSDDLRKAAEGLHPAHMTRAISRGMERGAALAVGDITKRRLTGKGPFPVSEHKLGVVTGRLRRSLHWTPARVVGDGVEVDIGARVEYAAAHEFGFSGSVQVKAHTRITKKGSHKVKAHKRTMKVPERAPVRTGLRENLDTFEKAVGDSIVQTMSQG
jgi:phage gpG-like protein